MSSFLFRSLLVVPWLPRNVFGSSSDGAARRVLAPRRGQTLSPIDNLAEVENWSS